MNLFLCKVQEDGSFYGKGRDSPGNPGPCQWEVGSGRYELIRMVAIIEETEL